MVTRERRPLGPQTYLAPQAERIAVEDLPTEGMAVANLAAAALTAGRQEVSVPVPATEPDLEPIPMPRWKRVMDIALSGVALVVLSPVFAAAAIAVRLDSPGPALFRQRRVGHGGREFVCLKFRSMCVDAEEQRAHLAHLNEANGHVFKIKNDPRRTRVGRFIRKTSIDELPQFWNVLKGEMSLVGPRPPLPVEVDCYDARERGRLRGVPGITGAWQVSARERHDFQEMLTLDLEYLEQISFLNDCRILMATIPAVLGARGSH